MNGWCAVNALKIFIYGDRSSIGIILLSLLNII